MDSRYTLTFATTRTTEGDTICAGMEKHAKGIVEAQKDVKRAAAKQAESMCGVYRVSFEHGALVRYNPFGRARINM